MADSAITKNVFLDTEVFDSHKFDLASALFRNLVRLAAEGHIKVLLTTVTVREVQSHIEKHAETSLKQIQNYRQIQPLARKYITEDMHKAVAPVTKEELCQELRAALDSFLADSKAIVLSIDSISPEEILRKYFAVEPPFGTGDKKSEFPDAFAAASLEQWCSDQGSQIYVVSGDKDWKRTCQESKSLIHVDKLSSLLEKFTDSMLVTSIKFAFTSHTKSLLAMIDEAAKAMYFFSSQGVEPEFEEPTRVDTTIDDYHVVRASEGLAFVSVFCQIAFEVTFTDDDGDTGVWDSEDKAMHYLHRVTGRVRSQIERDVIVELSYDTAHPEEIALERVIIEDNDVDVDIEDAELSYVDDDDRSYEDVFYDEMP